MATISATVSINIHLFQSFFPSFRHQTFVLINFLRTSLRWSILLNNNNKFLNSSFEDSTPPTTKEERCEGIGKTTLSNRMGNDAVGECVIDFITEDDGQLRRVNNPAGKWKTNHDLFQRPSTLEVHFRGNCCFFSCGFVDLCDPVVGRWFIVLLRRSL